LIYQPFRISRKKWLHKSCIFSKQNRAQKFFFEKLSFLKYLNEKNVFTAILNSAAILNFRATFFKFVPAQNFQEKVKIYFFILKANELTYLNGLKEEKIFSEIVLNITEY
jgi:hypothetical protein